MIFQYHISLLLQFSLFILCEVISAFHDPACRQLQNINPHWDDEKLYQESRRILNAEYQHILYNEFLPTLIGTQVGVSLATRCKISWMTISNLGNYLIVHSDNHLTQGMKHGGIGINTLTKGFSNDYQDNFDSRLMNEFATAAYRVGHTLISGLMEMYSTVKRQLLVSLKCSWLKTPPDVIQNCFLPFPSL